MNSSEPRRHHYIPQCYLKFFGNTQKQFWRRSNETRKSSICSPIQVGFETDYFKIRNEETMWRNNLKDYYHVEKYSFARQENNYTSTLLKVNRFSSKPLIIDKANYRLFLETLVTIKRRNPKTRETLINTFIESHKLKDTKAQFKQYLLEEAAKNNVILEEGIDSRIEEYIKNKGTNFDYQSDAYLSAFFNKDDYNVIDGITEQLYNLRQFILHSPLTTQFITSDNPGFIKNKDGIISVGGFGGDFEFYFPLNPQTCLYLSSSIPENFNSLEKAIYPDFTTVSNVSDINQWTKMVSNNKLFGHSKAILESV